MKLFNVGAEPVVVSMSERAVMPGKSYTFTAEQVAAGIAGQWSETDPRAVPMSRRESKAPAKAESNRPAEPEKE